MEKRNNGAKEEKSNCTEGATTSIVHYGIRAERAIRSLKDAGSEVTHFSRNRKE